MTNENIGRIDANYWGSRHPFHVVIDPETQEPVLYIPQGAPFTYKENICELNSPWTPTAEMLQRGIQPLKAGDKVKLKITAKVGALQNGITSNRGLTFGVDFYDGNIGRIWEVAPRNYPITDAFFNTPNNSDPAQYIKFNTTTWQTLELTVTIPNKKFYTDDYGSPTVNGINLTNYGGASLNGFIAWIGSNWRDGMANGQVLDTNPADLWIKRIELYINPTTEIIYACPYNDGLTFTTQEALNAHIAQAHGIVTESKTKVTLVTDGNGLINYEIGGSMPMGGVNGVEIEFPPNKTIRFFGIPNQDYEIDYFRVNEENMAGTDYTLTTGDTPRTIVIMAYFKKIGENPETKPQADPLGLVVVGALTILGATYLIIKSGGVK